MQLSASKPRRSLNEGAIRCQGYQREDGLWEVQAHLSDTRTYVSPTPCRSPVQARQAFHDMQLRLTFDDARCIREIEVTIDAGLASSSPVRRLSLFITYMELRV